MRVAGATPRRTGEASTAAASSTTRWRPSRGSWAGRSRPTIWRRGRAGTSACAVRTATMPPVARRPRAFGAGGGSLRPVAVTGEISTDRALREGHFVTGANKDGWHLRGVEAGRDYRATFADIRQTNAGDACPLCGGKLIAEAAIEL